MKLYFLLCILLLTSSRITRSNRSLLKRKDTAYEIKLELKRLAEAKYWIDWEI